VIQFDWTVDDLPEGLPQNSVEWAVASEVLYDPSQSALLPVSLKHLLVPDGRFVCVSMREEYRRGLRFVSMLT
jgi:hypothetical protein